MAQRILLVYGKCDCNNYFGFDAEKEEDELFDYNTDAVLKDVDFEEFAEFEEEQEEITDQTILDLMGEEFSRGTSRFSKPF